MRVTNIFSTCVNFAGAGYSFASSCFSWVLSSLEPLGNILADSLFRSLRGRVAILDRQIPDNRIEIGFQTWCNAARGTEEYDNRVFAADCYRIEIGLQTWCNAAR